MSRLRTKRDVIDRFINNQEFKNKAMETMDEPWFQAWLDAVLANMGPYSPDAPMNPVQHIQDRQDGGKAAINTFLHRLFNAPYTETRSDDIPDEEYVGYANHTSIQTATNTINRR